MYNVYLPIIQKGTKNDWLLEQLNIVRMNHGLNKLLFSVELENAAISHCNSMIKYDYFKHDSYKRNETNDLVFEMFWHERIKSFVSFDVSMAENIAFGYTLETVTNAFYESLPHKNNMLGDYSHAAFVVVNYGNIPFYVMDLIKV